MSWYTQISLGVFGHLNTNTYEDFWSGPELWWRVKSDQARSGGATAYHHYVYVRGEDRCGSGSWSFRMEIDKHMYNSVSADTGWKQGTYQDCSSGHSYRNWTAHQVQIVNGGP
jgi:hypothetical protein